MGYLAGGLDAIEVRHLNVHQDEVGPVTGRELDRFGTRVCDEAAVADMLQEIAVELEVYRMVVGEEDEWSVRLLGGRGVARCGSLVGRGDVWGRRRRGAIHRQTESQADRVSFGRGGHELPAVLLRYLALRLAGDAAADALLMHPAAAKGLPAYDAVVPLRFAPLRAPERFDERAGLVVRLAPNIARVNAALAVTVPTGQGKRLIEQIEVM